MGAVVAVLDKAPRAVLKEVEAAVILLKVRSDPGRSGL
jgi:hypothetical protein